MSVHGYEGAVRIVDKYGNDISYKYRAPKRTSFRGRLVSLIASASNRYWVWASHLARPTSEAR